MKPEIKASAFVWLLRAGWLLIAFATAFELTPQGRAIIGYELRSHLPAAWVLGPPRYWVNPKYRIREVNGKRFACRVEGENDCIRLPLPRGIREIKGRRFLCPTNVEGPEGCTEVDGFAVVVRP